MNSMQQHAFDVCVIGGGPAGAVIAARLREYGFTVALLEGATRSGWSCGYSIPAAAAEWLRTTGWPIDLEQAGALRLQGSLFRWRGEDIESREGAGFIVDPHAFSAMLRSQAAGHGAALFEGKVQRAERDAQGWQINCATGQCFTARFLVDATGRRSKFAGPRIAHLPRTAALVASFRDVPLPANHQRNEALPEGWLWGAPLPDGRWAVALFTDPAALQGLHEMDRHAQLKNYLAHSVLLQPCLEGTQSTLPFVCDATGERAADVATNDLLRIGDAALSLDPLSSQGVFAAMRSAWQGATVVRTILQRPESAAAAIAFHESRVAYGAAQNRAVAGEIYAGVQRFSTEPFWSARALPAADPASPRAQLSETIPLRMAASAALRPAPVLREGWIAEAPALYTPSLPLPAAYLGNIALAPLLRMIEPGCTGAELLRRWVKRLPLSQGQSLLQWLWRIGALEAAR